MPSNRRQKTRIVKASFLAITIIGIIVLLGFALSGNRNVVETASEKPATNEEEDAQIVISKFHQTSSRDGLLEWSLDADTALMNQEKKSAAFKNLSMTYYLENDNKVYLTADTGSLELESKNMNVTGNVVVTSDEYVLKTDAMHYRHEQRTFSSATPVKISGGSSELTADSLTFDLNTNQIVFDGKVRGAFGEAIAL